MSKPKVLIVEDDEPIRTELSLALDDEYEVMSATNRSEALKLAVSQKPGVVTLDLGLPPRPDTVQEGIRTLKELLRISPELKVIIVSGQDERQNAVMALEEGAFDFLAKPYELEELKVVLKRAFFIRDLGRVEDALAGDEEGSFLGMVGASPAIQEVFARIRRVSGSDASVLILGDSGTGKELAAQAIHQLSSRRDGPMIPINCGAIPSELLESELFGHEKGSFTGAHASRPGRIELAEGGTLFLDEIGEMPHLLQVKLLRFLQEGQIERVGGREVTHVNTRVVAASNQDLQASMESGAFRQDLFYRLAVIVIEMPPLRMREGDIPLLASHFLKKYAGDARRTVRGFTRQALIAMSKYPWPGNVRELENRVRRAVILSNSSQISISDLELEEVGDAVAESGLMEAREKLEKEMILRALERNQGNKSRTAEDLKISRPTLYDLMEKFSIEG